MDAIFSGLLVLAMVAVPLGLLVWSHRRREQADVVAATARATVRQRLEGDAFVTVDVTAPTPWAPGRVVLAAPAGYGWMVERSWAAVAQRVPADYELVVHAAPSPSKPSASVSNTRKRVVLAGALGSVVILGTLAGLSRPPAWLAVMLLVLFCLVTAYGVVIVAHGRSLFPDALAGRGVTTVNLAQVVGCAGLPILTGAIIATFPSTGGASPELAYRVTFGVIAAGLAAGLAVYAGARDVPPRPAPPPQRDKGGMTWAR